MKSITILLLSIALSVPLMAQHNGFHYDYPRRPLPQQSGRPGTAHHYHKPERPHGYGLHAHGNAYYGLRIGLTLSNVSSDDAYLNGSGVSTGVSMGVVAGYQLVPSAPLYFETGLSYVEKGGRGHYEGSKFTYDLNYLEVPLTLKYDYAVSRDVALQPFIGGYVACGVGGKVKDFGQRQAVSSFDEHFFRRFDGGLRLGCGVECAHLYAEVAYDLGLSNICHDTFNTSRNGCLTLTCGLNF